MSIFYDGEQNGNGLSGQDGQEEALLPTDAVTISARADDVDGDGDIDMSNGDNKKPLLSSALEAAAADPPGISVTSIITHTLVAIVVFLLTLTVNGPATALTSSDAAVVNSTATALSVVYDTIATALPCVPAQVPVEVAAAVTQRTVGVGAFHYLRDRLESAGIPYDAAERLRIIFEASGAVPNGDDTMIVGFASSGFLDFVLNWICHAERLGITNWMIGTIDSALHKRLTELGYEKHIFHVPEIMKNPDVEKCGGNDAHGYNHPCFLINTLLKLQIILVTLLAGYDTLFSDMDVTFVHNPLLYVPMQNYFESQREPFDGFCTGFMYWKSNLMNAGLFQQYITFTRTDRRNDQWTINERVYSIKDDDFKWGKAMVKAQNFPLKRILFPTGHRNEWFINTSVIQHNNWLPGASEKRQRIAGTGLDIYDHDTTNEHFNKNIKNEQTKTFLVCRPCDVCSKFVPSEPPLRATYPGPLLHTDFNKYKELRLEAPGEESEKFNKVY